MRKFEVLKCQESIQVGTPKVMKSPEGTNYTIIQWRKVSAGEPKNNGELWYPNAYGVEKIKVGDVIEINGGLADKAAKNPDFKEIKEKRGPGRPKKVEEHV